MNKSLILIASTGMIALAALPAQAKAPEKDAAEKICKKVDTIGSRIQKRVCKTAEEWGMASAATAPTDSKWKRRTAQANTPPIDRF